MEIWQESACCFDATLYTGTPDTTIIDSGISVPEIIRGLDALYAQGRESEAQEYLINWRKTARERGDWRAELSILSELMGQYRRSMDADGGIASVNDGLTIIREHRLGETVSGATVMLNAATTLKCFGIVEESLKIFKHVSRVYNSKLDQFDYRFAGLYNNMALSYSDIGDFENAERCYKLAMAVIRRCNNFENELAVTLCNMAEMYDKIDPEDARINECMEQAWELLNSESLPRDSYHAFTVSKCAPCFDYFGYFLYSKELKERAVKIYDNA